jgi:hypothetical protein
MEGVQIMSEGSMIPIASPVTKTLLKTVSTTQSLNTGASYTDYLWTAGELSGDYDALLIKVTNSNPTNFYMSIRDSVPNEVEKIRSCASASIVLIGQYGNASHKSFYTVHGSYALDLTLSNTYLIAGSGGSWSGTLTAQIYGIKLS